MKIILEPSPNTKTISEYFDFNCIPYTKLDLYDNQLDTYGRYSLDHDILNDNNILLIVNHNSFKDLHLWKISKQQIIDFCRRGNRIWVWSETDHLAGSYSFFDSISELDKEVLPEMITLFFDATPLPTSKVFTWRNIGIKIFPCNFFMNLCRIQNGSIKKKHNCEYDFMLTMGRKREPRDLLWKKLNDRPALCSRGKIIYHANEKNQSDSDDLYKKWLGDRYPHAEVSVAHPSMDLYNNSWLELVPETLYDHGYFFTEKTKKPISTKTPFIILSTPGYLKYLKELGFQTFESLIDESYDQENNLETRIDMILKLLEDIVNNGAKEFYYSCQEILDHNHKKLAEYTGIKEFLMDTFITENLEQIGIK